MQLSEQTTNLEPQLERITIVLRPQEISTLSQIRQFIQLGAPVAIGRGIAVIASCSDRDSIEDLDRAESQLVLAEAALKRATRVTVGADHLPALRRVIDHIPTLYLSVADSVKETALDDGDDHGMAEESAGQAIRVLVMLKQKLEQLLEPDLLTTETLVGSESMHIDDRVKMIGAEPAFLTVVFKLPSLNDAKPLIDLLPYGQKALGTEAEVHGFSAGNLMGVDPCEQ